MNINDYKLGKEINQFKDFVQEMLNGNILYNPLIDEFMKLSDNEFHFCYNGHENWSRTDLNEYAGNGWYVIETKKWFDIIPEHGIICWVSDSQSGTPYIQIVLKYYAENPYPFRTAQVGYRYATPLTNQEIKELFLTTGK